MACILDVIWKIHFVGIVVTVLVLVWFGRRLKRKEHNLVAYNLIALSFVGYGGDIWSISSGVRQSS